MGTLEGLPPKYLLSGVGDEFIVTRSYWWGALQLGSAFGCWAPTGTTAIFDIDEPEEFLVTKSRTEESYVRWDRATIDEGDAANFSVALLKSLDDVPDFSCDGDTLIEMLSGRKKKRVLERIARLAHRGCFTITGLE